MVVKFRQQVLVLFIQPRAFMKSSRFRLAALSCLLVPALAGSLLLSGCNSEPTATETDKTATVIPSEATEASDSAATVAPADSAGTTTAQ
jgi:hypothetical protein